MNETLFAKCLTGDTPDADWQELDRRLSSEPALAQAWCAEVQMDTGLHRLFSPRTVRTRHKMAACWTAAAAASLVFGWFAMQPGSAPNQTSRSLVPASPPVSLPAAPPVPVPPPTPSPAAEPAAKPAADASPRIISRVNTKEKVMALTFEDGPSAHTPRLLDMLKQEGVKATFFPVGSNLDRSPEIARRIVVEGHELGNHTQTHPYLSRQDEARVRAEIAPCQEKIRALTGQNPTLFRPPYGAITAPQKEFIAREYKSTIVLWSVDPQDWKYRDTARTITAVLQQAGEGRIVLLHDIHATSVDAVPEIVRRLKADGWKLTTVSELMKLESKPGTGQ